MSTEYRRSAQGVIETLITLQQSVLYDYVVEQMRGDEAVIDEYTPIQGSQGSVKPKSGSLSPSNSIALDGSIGDHHIKLIKGVPVVDSSQEIFLGDT